MERFTLVRRQTRSIRSAHAPIVVVAREGTLWVTAAGDGRDHVLGPGDSVSYAPGVHVVVEAIGGEAFCEVSEEPAARLRAAPLLAARRALEPLLP